MKKWREFPRSGKQKVTNYICFLNFPARSKLFSSLMKCWCNALIKNPLFSGGTPEMSLRRHNSLLILHIYKQTTESISKRASQQGEPCLLNSQMPKKSMLAQVQIKRRTTSLRTTFPVCHVLSLQPELLPELASRTKDAQKAVQYIFPSDLCPRFTWMETNTSSRLDSGVPRVKFAMMTDSKTMDLKDRCWSYRIS